MTQRYRTYNRYIESPQWQVVRARIMLRAGGVCEHFGCLETARTVHHLTYERLTRELDSDLTALCWPHHKSCHVTWEQPTLEIPGFPVRRLLVA
jgi:hypothetical protein